MMKAMIGFVVLLAVVFAGSASAQPKIEVREIKHDFGKVVQGTQVSHVFEVRNAGTEVLIIERVQPS